MRIDEIKKRLDDLYSQIDRVSSVDADTISQLACINMTLVNIIPPALHAKIFKGYATQVQLNIDENERERDRRKQILLEQFQKLIDGEIGKNIAESRYLVENIMRAIACVRRNETKIDDRVCTDVCSQIVAISEQVRQRPVSEPA